LDLFDRATIVRMAGHLRTILEGIVSDPNCSIRALPLLTAYERQKVLYGFNDTTAKYPRHMAIHEVFEREVLRTPNAIAAMYDSRTLTYLQLNARANRLAHHLREQGVQIGEYVPIVMTRSLEMLIAQLAVLKCGAAYVPVDPSMPGERQAF